MTAPPGLWHGLAMASREPSPPLRTDFDNSVGFLLTALANKLSITGSRRLRAKLNIGLMEWRCLALLAVEGEVTPARIAQVAGVDKSVVSRAVGALDQRGLVRVMAGPAAGRQTRLELTAKGLEMHDQGMPDTIWRETELLHGLSDAERTSLVGLLKRLTANLARLT